MWATLVCWQFWLKFRPFRLKQGCGPKCPQINQVIKNFPTQHQTNNIYVGYRVAPLKLERKNLCLKIKRSTCYLKIFDHLHATFINEKELKKWTWARHWTNNSYFCKQWISLHTQLSYQFISVCILLLSLLDLSITSVSESTLGTRKT